MEIKLIFLFHIYFFVNMKRKRYCRKEVIEAALNFIAPLTSLIVNYDHYTFKGKIQITLEKVKNITAVIETQNILILGLENGDIQIWDLNLKKLIKTLEWHIGPVISFAVYKDLIISSSEDATIRVWDLKTFSNIQSYFNNHIISNLNIIEDQLIFASFNSIKIWDLKNYIITLDQKVSEKRITNVLVSDGVIVTFAEDEKKWTLSGDNLIRNYQNRYACISNKYIIRCLEKPIFSNQFIFEDGILLCLILSDQRVLSISTDKILRVWDHQRSEIIANELTINHLLLLISGKVLIISEDDTIQIWN